MICPAPIDLIPGRSSRRECGRDRLPQLTGALAAIAIVLLGGATGRSQSSDHDAIETGRTALRRTGDYPWYDRGNDVVRRVDAIPRKNSPNENRHSKWVQKPRDPTAGANWSFSGFGEVLASLMKVLFWGLIASILAALVWLLIRVFLKMEQRQASASKLTLIRESSSDVDRVESLPFKVKQPKTDLLSEAQRQYDLGNYRDAMIYLFSYMLLYLDKHHQIHLAKGKTNRQYLWEVRPKLRLSQLVETSMIAFEDVFFGNHELQRSEFEECWQGLDEFHRLASEGSSQ